MDLESENPETERLAAEVAEVPAKSETDRMIRLRRYLEEEVWPQIDPDLRGKPISKEEIEEMLGYGPDGV